MTRPTRSKGEGSIFQRASDARWVGVVDLGRREGRRQRKTVYGASRREVADKLKALLRDQQLGTLPTGPNQTVATWLETWLGTWAKAKVRPSTYRTYEGYVRLHLVPALGSQRLDKLTPDHVQTLLNRKLAEGMPPRTVHHLRAILRAALGRAVKNGILARNVAALVDGPTVERYEARFLEPAEAKALLDASGDDDLGTLIRLVLFTGLRQGEALGLRWSDLDLDAGTLKVSNALQRVDHRLQLVPPKTKRSRRTIAITPSVVESLRELRRLQTVERLRAGAKWQDFDLVFTRAYGMPLDGTRVTHRLQALLERSGLPRIRFHDLRHSAASLMASRGVPLRVIMEQLGHSTIAVTADIYSHVMPAALREAADSMEQVLGS